MPETPAFICPRCGAELKAENYKHAWTSALGAIIQCETATPKQIEEYKAFRAQREIRRRELRQQQEEKK